MRSWGLDSGQSRTSFTGWKIAILTVYAVLVCWMIRSHEPWSDEAQAWLLARDSSLRELLFRRLHYEGTPGLWSALLWLESRLGVSYGGMHWIAGTFAVLAIYVLLRYSPFPRWMQMALPFSVPLLYQTPIVARSYVLSILFMFMLAALYRAPRHRTYLAALLCGLLANTSVFGCALSAGFALLFLWKEVKARRKPFGALSVLLLLWTCAVTVAVPAPDVDYGIGGVLNAHPPVSRMLSRLTGIPVPASLPHAVAASALPPERMPAFEHDWQRRLWLYVHWRKPHPLGVLPVRYGMQIGATLTFIATSFVPLAVLFYATLLLWLISHRALHATLPFLLLLLCGLLTGMSEHHHLLLWGAGIACLWMAWPEVDRSQSKIDVAFLLTMGAVLLQQIIWSAAAYRHDMEGSFDPGMAVARFVKDTAMEKPGRRVAGVDFSLTSAEPFFAVNPFYNWRTSYWPWQRGQDPDEHVEEVLAQRPDYIITGESRSGPATVESALLPWGTPGRSLRSFDGPGYLLSHGYKETHRFCGEQPMHLSYSEQNCSVVFEPVGADPNPAR